MKKGVDIIFCTPGSFNAEVIEVAEEKDVLVILVGADRSSESPDHVLTSLLLRDDNTVFEAVRAAVDGDLAAGPPGLGRRGGHLEPRAVPRPRPLHPQGAQGEAARDEENIAEVDFGVRSRIA